MNQGKDRDEISIAQADGFVRITLSGEFPRGGRRDLMLAIREAADALGATHLLVDARRMPPPLSELDRHYAGVAVAEVLGGRFRVAVLFPGEQINKFAENTAVNRGAQMLVTADEAAAMAWLLRDD